MSPIAAEGLIRGLADLILARLYKQAVRRVHAGPFELEELLLVLDGLGKRLLSLPIGHLPVIHLVVQRLIGLRVVEVAKVAQAQVW